MRATQMSPRQRKKRNLKRLDAICEKVYNSNRLGGGGVEVENAGAESGELRRSSRVRKAPEFLDASPLPLRKKQRVDGGGGVGSSSKNGRWGDGRKKGLSRDEDEEEEEEEEEGWKSRLRSSRGQNVGGNRGSSRRKRMLFDGDDGVREETEGTGGEMGGEKEGVMEEKLQFGKLKRQISGKGKIFGSGGLDDEDKEGNDDNLGERLGIPDESENVGLKGSMVDGTDEVVANDGDVELIEKEEGASVDGLRLDEEQSRGVEGLEEKHKRTKQAECEMEGVNHIHGTEEVSHPVDEAKNGGSCVDKAECPAQVGRKQLEDGDVVQRDKLECLSTDRLEKSRVREGRRCGLCGRGNDGRPPKRLGKDSANSDNEAYGGSSSEEANYDTWDGFGDEPGWLGRLQGPIHDRFGIAGVWVHQQCAVWSPEVYFAGLGCLKNVKAALFRGRALKCSRCGRPGATIGCRVDRCPKTYHLPCGRADGCIFDHRKFLIACVDHRHLFQPQGNHYVHRIKKLKAKKLKLEMRKLSHDAWRKDYEAEEKWLENCGEDEEFLKREGKRLHRDILRIAPVYIGGPSSGNEKLGQGWESVAGLEDVVRCMKEVVLLPLLYPEFFSSLGLTPPRGVLLHGYPGTGKTLVVRALIGSCARGDRRIAYFARKGADCLGKYVGDAERQLRLLFQVAEKSQPSIIFFDEIDGLAPCRTRQQDQTHNSVVSTLLALMDGLKSRGSVIVIGATNRPDAVDPALRRPGRFDREIYFPLPSAKDRAAILSVHTQKWPNPVSGTLLKLVAQKTAGFAGADLQALCTQVAMIALKRNCTLQELVSAGGKMAKGGSHLPLSSFHVEEKDWLDALARAPPPCSRREAGMAANEVVSSPLPLHLSPCLLQPLSYLLVSLYRDERVLLPPFLYKAAKMIETAIVSALEQTGKSKDYWWSYLPDLIEKADIAREIERGLSCAGLLIGASNSGISDALNGDDNARNEFELRKVSCTGGSTGLLKSRCYLPDRNPGFRVLITGEPKSGQRHLASCLLHGFAGCVEIQKVDLATISQEGHGDEIEGMTHILYVEASQWSKLPTYNNLLPSLAVKCFSKDLCVVYLPRIDFWAMETQHDNDEKEHEIFENTSTSVDTTGPCDAKRTPSQLWNSFVEQVESMHSSASLMILATSEAPSEGLPRRITQFFTTDALNFRGSTSSEHTIPRFLVQTDGKFDCNMVINSSAIELSHSLVQQHIQLLHNKTHIAKAQNKAGDVIEGNVEPESHKTSAGSDMLDKMKPRKACNGDASFNDDKTQPHKNAVEQSLPGSTTAGHQEDLTRLCLPQDAGPRILPNNKIVKGKSNLLVAISSFGYQILLYPHFSELCWATSKLKEGPCTDINGPWKGWPFNSCIVRPSNSLERVALGCSSDNLKHKEQSGLVRGLIAVGLLAYRGVYTSVREVAFDVREVLQLLVEQVGAKILCGKDRCRFLRLLSQVAYLEDMVNSWAYTLQSLERDTQMTSLDPGQVIVDHPSENNPVRSDTCKPKTFQRDSDDVQVQQQGLPIFAAEGVAQIDIPNSDATIIDQEEPSQHSLQIPKSPVVPLTSENNLNAKNKESCAEESISDDHISVELHHGSFRPSKQSNGLGEEGCILPSEDGLHVRDELNVVTKSGSRKGSDGSNCLSSDDRACNTDELVGAAKSTVDKNNGVSAVSKTCLYTCCSECLHLVYILIQKILLHEKEASGSCWTVDNVHDVVASWSLNLLSAARELYNVESFNESIIDDGCGKRCACPDVGSSRHESAVNQAVIPLHCRFHLESKSIRESISGLGLDFCFRDNLLISSDVNRDVLLHCKFGNLCLGALIERISMIRQPLY